MRSPSPSPARPAILQCGCRSSLETTRHWMEELADVGCSKGGSSLALCERLPGLTGRSLSSRALVFLYEDLLGRAAGFPRLPGQPSALEPGSHQRQLEKRSGSPSASAASGPSCCFQGLRKHRPISQLPPLARRVLELLWAQCWPVTA